MKKTLLCLTAVFLMAAQFLTAQNTCFSDWRYVRTVSFTSVFSLTDFPVFFDLDTQTLIANGKMNPDGSDLRIAGDDCCQELNYWIQTPLNTPNTRIWVLMPNVNGPGATNITVYYGNAAANVPISNIDSVMLSIGNDSTGTAPANPMTTIGTQRYRFSTDCKTVRWRVYTGDSATFRLKSIDSTDRVRGFSGFFSTPQTPGFYEFDFEGNSTQDGYPAWYSLGGMEMMNNCMPAVPCPGSCGDMKTLGSDAGTPTQLTGDDCGAFPSMKVWYRNVAGSFYVDPTHSIDPEFDRQGTLINVTATKDTICVGDTTVLTASAGGAQSFIWYRDSSFVGTGSSLTATVPGDYYCVGTFGTCLTANSAIYTITLSNGSIDLGADRVECTDSTYVLDAGPGYASYLWSNSSTGQTLTISTSGIFWVTATDSAGCVFRDTVIIQLQPYPNPSITPGPEVFICEGGFATLDAFQQEWFIYDWFPNGETSASIQASVAGTYQVTVTDSFGCTGTAQPVLVSTYPLTQVMLPADTTICGADSLVLTTTSEWDSILWADSLSNMTSYTVYTEGDYWIEVLDTNGCPSRDTIRVDNFADITVDIGGDSTICFGSQVTLAAGPGFSAYEWSDQSTTPSINVGAGTYFVIVHDGNGCSAMSNMVNISEYPELATPTIAYSNGVLSSNSTADNYQWYGPSGTAIPGATQSTYTPTEAGEHYLEVSDNNGCSLFISNVVEVVLAITKDDIPQGFSPNGDDQNDRFEIAHISQYPGNSLSIVNRWGSEVFSAAPYANTFNGQYEGKDLPAGTYFYILDLGDDTEPISGYLIIKR